MGEIDGAGLVLAEADDAEVFSQEEGDAAERQDDGADQNDQPGEKPAVTRGRKEIPFRKSHAYGQLSVTVALKNVPFAEL